MSMISEKPRDFVVCLIPPLQFVFRNVELIVKYQAIVHKGHVFLKLN